ncbi:MAG: HTTM domain-containing protein [Gammaproteobacteria bacterium]|nr:HTTM domain-containing protein [Gammaproteobacteria bacterium]
MLTNRLKTNLFKPIDSSFLVVFRIGFAVIMFWEIARYWSNDWIRTFYIEPGFYFKYYGFEWVHPWAGEGMYYHFIAMGILAIFIGTGFLYRLSALLFFVAFCYLFLLDQSRYLNHFYLVILISFLLIILPANRCYSVDAKIRPALHSHTVPAWSIWILRAQFEIVYLYAGLVKINSDWLNLEPLRMWLSMRSDLPLVGQLYTQDWAIAAAAYGVILLHVVGALLLLWKRTRLAVFVIYAAFHTLNHFTFNIGIFPWMTLFGTLVFFDPDWPKQLADKISRRINPGARRFAAADNRNAIDYSSTAGNMLAQNTLMVFFGVWLMYQILFPLRHLLYPGNVSWTEEGHQFAWQMKLRDKQGFADFIVYDPASGQRWYIKPELYLTKTQTRKMAIRPDMILQFAHYLEAMWKKEYGLDNVEIRVNNYVSLNGREPAPLVNPSVDLTKIEPDLRHANWILPLQEPLKRVAQQ